MRLTFYGAAKFLLNYCNEQAQACNTEGSDNSREEYRARWFGKMEAYLDVSAKLREVLAHDLYASLFEDAEQADRDESLKKTILRKWLRAKTPADKDRVRGEIAGAMHEMVCEALSAEHELRVAIMSLQSQLDGIVFGNSLVPHWDITKRLNEGAECAPQNKAPLVGLAGHIAAMLYLRGALRDQMLAEWEGCVVHAQRTQDAMKAQKVSPCIDGMTGYIAPIDKLSVPCRICNAPKGKKCVQPKVET